MTARGFRAQVMEPIVVADIGSYYHTWHLYLLGVFLIGWLLGGGWLIYTA